ncbi:transposase [Rhodococcus koreensis]
MSIRASALSVSACCPACGDTSDRVHSRYERTVADTAIGNRPSRLVLRVRRFLCLTADCERRTFAEQIDGVTTRYAPRTPLLRGTLERIGLAMAGRAGARLATAVGVHVGRSTLRRRHRYGTVLIDMATHRPVDVLADRKADTFADWLTAHPGTTVVCRDRAGAYAEGARTGAPDAIEVADRWHLWHNLAEAVEKTVAAQHGCLRANAAVDPEPIIDRTAAEGLRRAAEQAHTARREQSVLVARTKRRYEAVAALKAQGKGIKPIQRELGLAKETVRRYYRAGSVDELLATPRAGLRTVLDEFTEHLHERWNDGCTTARTLFDELRALGYRGSYATVRDYLRPFRDVGAAPPATPKIPKVRTITSWMLHHPDNLTDDEQLGLKQVLASCQHLETTAAHVTSFAEMLTGRHGDRLSSWMAAAASDDLPHLHRFVRGIERDHAAVLNGLTLPYNSGAGDCPIFGVSGAFSNSSSISVLRQLASGQRT